AAAHKYHTSFTRVEYNAEEKSAEITMQTFADDLENVLSRRAGRSIRLDKGKDVERLVFDYLRDSFELKGREGGGALRWVGMETKADAVWIYLEAPMPEGLSGATLRNGLLLDLFRDQVNIVNVLYGGKKVDLVFKRGESSSRLIP
ncbi:MAG: DUF6702 family protein, partial [Pyrinomonadaceae bacterium]